ncbi:hypothetical protein MMC28_008231 [Mycoblastus sanguinarius]|nr:hypothetical protein [Mycoblastus sanguinarius]
MPLLLSRYYNNDCDDGIDDGDCSSYNSPWSNWGRWVVLAAIIVIAFLVFLSFSCINARRRRRQGMQPYRGTGWAAGRTPEGHGPAQYTGASASQPYYPNPAPPVYSPQQNQGYANQGYFGGQQQGVELQQPENTYQPVYNYAPPAGPPPGKKDGDGIIR